MTTTIPFSEADTKADEKEQNELKQINRPQYTEQVWKKEQKYILDRKQPKNQNAEIKMNRGKKSIKVWENKTAKQYAEILSSEPE